VTEVMHDVARIGHAELLTPTPDESLRFFVDVLGMEEEAREGQSVYLRGWGDYLRYSLRLTEAPQAGLGHTAFRAWSPEALERRVAAIETTGLGTGWIDGDVGHGPAYRFADPDGHVFEPGGNRIEVTTGGYFVYDPDFEPITWTAAERARGQFRGVQTIESFHTYGTPDVEAPSSMALVPSNPAVG